MTITQAVRAYLASRASIIALVGTRVSCTHRDLRKGLPAITINKVSGGHEHDLDGSAGNAMPRVQVNCWAATDTDADDLAEATRNVMDGFVGTMGTVDVGVVILDNELDLYEEPDAGQKTGTYHIAQDFMIRHHESKPTFV